MILRKLLSIRMIALLFVVGASVLVATGIVSVRMENGRPKVTFNQQRAAEVREEAADKVQDFRQEHGGGKTAVGDFVSDLGVGNNDTVGEKFEGMTEGISENVEQVRHIEFGGEPEKSGFRPFADLKEKAASLRR